jgi:hypothetical protein
MARGDKKVAKLDVTLPDGATTIDIYLNTTSGVFSATLGDERYANEGDLNGLKVKLKNAASAMCARQFEPCIVYKLYGVRERVPSWESVDPVVGVRFYAVAISGGAPDPADPVDCALKRYKLRADVGTDGVFRVHKNEPEAFYAHGERVIPFTLERWRALQDIQAIIDNARERLVAVLGRDRSVGDITGLLDAVGAGNGGQLLLLAQSTTTTKAKP